MSLRARMLCGNWSCPPEIKNEQEKEYSDSSCAPILWNLLGNREIFCIFRKVLL